MAGEEKRAIEMAAMSTEDLKLIADRWSGGDERTLAARAELERRGVRAPRKRVLKSGVEVKAPPGSSASVVKLLHSYRIDGERWKLFNEVGKPATVFLDGEAPKGLRSKLAALSWALKVDKRSNYERNSEDDGFEFEIRKLDREAGSLEAPRALEHARSERYRASRGWGQPVQAARAVGGVEDHAERGS